MRDTTMIAIRSVLGLLVIANLAVLVGLAFPAQTSAETTVTNVSVQTTQLLPPGGNACAPALVSGFTPYIYDGTLQAFEFNVSDSSYVALAGSAGATGIPFNQMTRRADPSGAVRIHADIQTTPVRDNLIVTVTMLSAKSEQPVCIAMFSATLVPEESSVTPVVPITPTPTPLAPASSGTTKAPTQTRSPAPKTSTSSPSDTEISTTTDMMATSSATTTAVSSSVVTTRNFILDACSSGVGALRLWTILLLVYALIVVAAIVGQPQLPAALRTQEWTAAAIVVPFLLLFGLWYFAESCRTSSWIPVIATVIALAGLAGAFWERKDKKGSGSTTPSKPNVINLPGSRTQDLTREIGKAEVDREAIV